MPNPLFLKVMGITIHQYNSYSPSKKARFQTAAQKKLAEVHESDIDAYTKLTAATEEQAVEDAEESEFSEGQDEEFK